MSSRAAQRKLKLKVKLGKAQHSPKVLNDDDSFEVVDGFSDSESKSKRARLSHDGSGKKQKLDSSNNKANFSSLFLPNVDTEDAFVGLNIMQLLQLKDVDHIDAFQRAALLTSKLIYPSDLSRFYQSTWEKAPYLGHPSEDGVSQLGKFLSAKQLKRILAANVFTLNEDLVANPSLVNLLRRQGIACEGSVLWKAFETSEAALTFTIKSPQKLHQASWQLLSALEFQFNSQVDSSWTCQSVGWEADEADLATTSDFDQFILQFEGRSTWEVLIKTDKDQNNIPQRFEVHAGSSLYLSKKAVRRQIKAHAASISLFMIISTNHQSHSVANFLQFLIPQALTNLEQESHLFSRGLPPRLRTFTSVSAATAEDGQEEDSRRDLFKKYVSFSLMSRLQDQVEEILDAGADQVAKNFILERLPVPLSADEEAKTSAGLPDAIIYPYTILRMIRPEIAIAVVEDGKIVVYHCMDNGRVPGAHENSPLEFELDDGPAIELLLKAYPEGVMVQDLPHPSEELEDKVGIAQALFKEGFILIVDETSRPADNGESESRDDQMDEENDNQLL